MTRILVVDDEDVIVRGFKNALARYADQYEVTGVLSAEAALEELGRQPYDLLFTDLKMPGMDGLELLEKARAAFPETDAVMMTGFSTVESAVGAMKSGALDYVLKPFSQDELLAIVRKVVRIRHSRIAATEEQEGFIRWSPQLRFQHIILMITFILLTITGVPLLFPDLFKGVFFFEDSSLLRGLMHRVAAVALMILSIYHVGYAAITDDGHYNMKAMLPRIPGDLKEFWGFMMYVLGRREEKPRTGRYDMWEKFEYFGVVWGTLVMVISGLILWFADLMFRFVPLWVVDAAKVVHRWEAILAILVILVWHTYNVHFKPGVWPGLKVWSTGRVSREYMILHHPLEYEEITGRPAVLDEVAHDGEEAKR
jgi:formate dehydrogenase gamma subunit